MRNMNAHDFCGEHALMSSATYDKNGPKRAVNVSINADLAARAKQLGLNLSEALETRLAELVTTAERQRWLVENAEAIEAYNQRVESTAILSDFERPF
jgi:antitoxin CcdA